MSAHSDAVAELADTVGQALLRFAEQVRSREDTTAVASGGARPTRSGLGTSQAAVYDALVEAGQAGLTAKEAADKCGLKSTNTPQIMARLAARGVVAATDDVPKVWRVLSEAPDTRTSRST